MSFFYFKRCFILAGFFLTALTFTGCSLFDENAGEELVTINLPAWPPESDSETETDWPPLSRWKITLASNEGISVFHAAPGTQLEFSVQKNCPFSVQAAPVTLLQDAQEVLYFHPAGYLYPFSSQNQPNWEQGYAAFIMEGLYKNCFYNGFSSSQAARYVSTFNWEKFSSVIKEKLDQGCLENKKYYNPWLCDSSKILKNLSEETFRASLLTPSGCYQLSTQKLYEESGLSVLSPFILENQLLSKTGQITIKKDSPLLLSDAKKSGVFITYKSAKNVQIEYIYMPIYKEEI